MVLLVTFSMVCGCFQEKLPQVKLIHHQKRPLRFGTLPILAPQELEKALMPLTDYLSEHLSREIEIIVAQDYADMAKMSRLGRLDLAWIDGGGKAMRSLCQVVAKGRGYYQGIIISRRDGPVKKLDDLRGKHFAFVDRNSSSGFIYPNKVLTKAGLSPLQDFSEISFAGSHSQCLAGVLTGNYDGAAMSDIVLTNPKSKDNAAKFTTILARTEVIYPYPISISQALDKELGQKVLALLLSLPESAKGKAILEKLGERLNIRHFAQLRKKK